MKKIHLGIAGALLHLTLVGLGAAQHPMESPDVLVAYCDFTGANNGWGFFAPSVACDSDVVFLAKTPDGRSRRLALPMASEEGRLRTRTAVAFLGMDDLRVLLGASWSATIFAQMPNAESVTVIASLYDLPPPARYAAGQKPGWHEVYRAEFMRGAEVRR